MNTVILLALMSLAQLIVIRGLLKLILQNDPKNMKLSFGKLVIESEFSTKTGRPR